MEAWDRARLLLLVQKVAGIFILCLSERILLIAKYAGSPPGPSLRDKHLCQQGSKAQWWLLKRCSYRQQEEEYGLIWTEKHSKIFVPKVEPAVTEIDFFFVEINIKL